VFTTSAGIHQAGVARQDEAPGGLIYLPFAASLFGRKENELSRVGSLSGSEGIVSILNRHLEAAGKEQSFSNTSRVVKQIYDKIQDEYDGQYDDASKSFKGYRKDFYTSEEIVGMAKDLGAPV
jgi:isopropylmalate/homocitrate/citramalate synthase